MEGQHDPNSPFWMQWFWIEMCQYLSIDSFRTLSLISNQFNEIWIPIRNKYLLPTQRMMNKAAQQEKFELIELVYEMGLEKKFDPSNMTWKPLDVIAETTEDLLMFTCGNKRQQPTKLVRFLLNDKRINPNFGDSLAFQFACENGHSEIIDLFFKKNVIDIFRYKNELESIFSSIRNEHAHCLPIFLENHVPFLDSWVFQMFDWTPKMIRTLFDLPNFQIVGNDAKSWWTLAAEKNEYCIVSEILQHPKMDEFFRTTNDVYRIKLWKCEWKKCKIDHFEQMLSDTRFQFDLILNHLNDFREESLVLASNHPRMSARMHCEIVWEGFFSKIDHLQTNRLKFANEVAKYYVKVSPKSKWFIIEEKISVEKISFKEFLSEMKKLAQSKSQTPKQSTLIPETDLYGGTKQTTSPISFSLGHECLFALIFLLHNEDFLEAIGIDLVSFLDHEELRRYLKSPCHHWMDFDNHKEEHSALLRSLHWS